MCAGTGSILGRLAGPCVSPWQPVSGRKHRFANPNENVKPLENRGFLMRGGFQAVPIGRKTGVSGCQRSNDRNMRPVTNQRMPVQDVTAAAMWAESDRLESV